MSTNAEASSSRHKDKEHRRKHKDHKDHKSKKDKKDKKTKLPKAQPSGVDGPFELRLQRMRLSVPPKFSLDWLEGVRDALDGMLMRYVPQMGGVLLAHWDHQYIDDSAKIINECPFGVVDVQFKSIVWAPRVGQVLTGTHSLSSPSHISLLFAKTFNVSIPLNHIPLGQYEFEHSDEAADESSDEEDTDDGELFASPAVHEVGRWKESATGKVLGSGGERVQFTVIDLQVTNNVLSLTGSLLADPTNPPAMPLTAPGRLARSESPDLPPPPKVARTGTTSTPRHARAQNQNQEDEQENGGEDQDQEDQEDQVDTSKMSARELKKYRKDQEKAKRDARKARKEDAGVGEKRKAEDGEEGARKKRKE